MFQVLLFLFVSSVLAQTPFTNSELQERICVGFSHSCSVSTEGKVRCWGDNTYGQLGYGDTIKRGDGAGEMGSALPYVDLGGISIAAIDCGLYHTCVRTSGANSQIKCWGRNNHGQLGYGDTANRGDEPGEMGSALPFVNVGGVRSVRLVSTGGFLTCVLLDSNNVKCWGLNDRGQLGIGSNTNLLSPPSQSVDIDQPGGVVQISACESHICVRLNNGRVKCWGGNGAGQLGLGDTANRGDGPGEMGSALPLLSLGSGHQVTQIQTSSGISCARLADETVKCWGSNSVGQLGFPYDPLNRNIGDQSGEMGSALASVDFGTSAANVQWIGLGFEWTCVYFVDGRLKCYGILGESLPPNDNSAYINLGTGNLVDTLRMNADHACVIIGDPGHVKCFGDNTYGQLGQGNTVHKLTFTQLGNTFPFVDLRSASAPNPTNPTPNPTNPTPNPTNPTPNPTNPAPNPTSSPPAPNPTNPTPNPPPTSSSQVGICVGFKHSCSLSTEGNVRCWGDNTYGQLGYGDTVKRGDGAGEMGANLQYVDLGNIIIDAIYCGYDHTCARGNSQIKCWGRNNHGQLGYGDRLNRGDGPGEMGSALPFVNVGGVRSVRLASLGYYFTCVLLDSNNVKCWGLNDRGQLGIGSTTTLLAPQSSVVDIDQPGAIQQISTSGNHVCARLTNGRAKCWGSNGAGQLGLGDTNDRGDGPGEMGSALPLIALGPNHQVTQIQAGPGVSCARLADQTVKCWGLNSIGQLGYPTDILNLNIGDEPDEMGSALASVDFGTSAANVQWIGLGIEWTCVYFVDGRLKCYGNLGESSPPNDNGAYIDLGTGNLVQTLRMKMEHACVILENGQVKCFGENDHGQLGQGNTVNKYIFTQLGDTFPFVDLTTPRPPTGSPTNAPVPPTPRPTNSPTTVSPTNSPTTGSPTNSPTTTVPTSSPTRVRAEGAFLVDSSAQRFFSAFTSFTDKPLCIRIAGSESGSESPDCYYDGDLVAYHSYDDIEHVMKSNWIDELYVATLVQKTVDLGSGPENVPGSLKQLLREDPEMFTEGFRLCPNEGIALQAYVEVGLNKTTVMEIFEDAAESVTGSGTNSYENALFPYFLYNGLQVGAVISYPDDNEWDDIPNFIVTKCKLVPENSVLVLGTGLVSECSQLNAGQCAASITEINYNLDGKRCSQNEDGVWGYCRDPRREGRVENIELCPAGFVCSGSRQARDCDPGFYCPNGTTENTLLECPAGFYCPESTSSPLECSLGEYCPRGTSTPALCPLGFACPNPSVIEKCPADKSCPPGSTGQGIACNAYGTRNRTDLGECSCYNFVTGTLCDTLTVFGTQIKYNTFTIPREKFANCSNLAADPYSDCLAANADRITEDIGKCPFKYYSYPSNIAAASNIDGCCFEVHVPGGLPTGSLTREELTVDICSRNFEYGGTTSSLNVSELNFETDMFLGLSAGNYHYCCSRFSGTNSIGRMLSYEQMHHKIEDLLGVQYYDQFEEDYGVIGLKHFYSGVFLMVQGHYFYAQIAFSYVYDIFSKLIDEEGNRIYLDLDDAISRSIDLIKGELNRKEEFIDVLLPQKYKDQFGSDKDFKPEFAVLLLRLESLKELQIYMTDTFAKTLSPISNDVDAFLNINSEENMFSKCRFKEDGDINFPGCSFSSSDVFKLEHLLSISRCAILPRAYSLTAFASNIVPPQTYLGQAFHCLKQIEVRESNKNAYAQSLLFLSEATEQVLDLYELGDSYDIEYLLNTMNDEIIALRAVNTNKNNITRVRDNTADYYDFTLASLEDRLGLNLIRYDIQQQTQTITAAIDAQTTTLQNQINQQNYDLFQYLNNSFSTVFNSFHASVDYEEEPLDNRITTLNKTIYETLDRLAVDLDIFREYNDVFQERLELLFNKSIERIDILYDRDVAEADLKLAKARLNFIAAIILEVVAIAANFIPGIGPLISVAIGLVGIGVSEAITAEEPRGSQYTGDNLRRLQEERPTDIETYIDSFANFSYNETSIQLFTSLSSNAVVIVSDLLEFCYVNESARLIENIAISELEPSSAEENCIDILDSALFTLFHESVTRDYMYGCGTTETPGLEPRNRFMVKNETLDLLVGPALNQIIKNMPLTIQFYQGIIFEIDTHFGCKDDFFGEYNPNLPLNRDNNRRRRTTTDPFDDVFFGFDNLGNLREGGSLSYGGDAARRFDDVFTQWVSELGYKIEISDPFGIHTEDWDIFKKDLFDTALDFKNGGSSSSNFLLRDALSQRESINEALNNLGSEYIIDDLFESLSAETDPEDILNLADDGRITSIRASDIIDTEFSTPLIDVIEDTDDFLQILDLDSLDDVTPKVIIDALDDPIKVSLFDSLFDVDSRTFFGGIMKPGRLSTELKSPIGVTDELMDLPSADTIRSKFDSIGDTIDDGSDVIGAKKIHGAKMINKFNELSTKISNTVNNAMKGFKTQLAEEADELFGVISAKKIPGQSVLKGAGRFVDGIKASKTAGKIGKVGSKIGTAVAPAAKVVGKALGPVMVGVGVGFAIDSKIQAENQHGADLAAAENRKNSRYAIIFELFDTMESLFGEVIVEFQKQVLQVQIINSGYECELIFNSSYCSDISLTTAGLWDDIGFKLIDFLQSGSGLCPFTKDFDVFEQDGFRRLTDRLDDRRLTPGTEKRFLSAVDDKNDAENRINEAQAKYNAATELMHSKLCPDYISIVKQLTSYGKNVQTTVFQIVQQVRELNELAKNKKALIRQRQGLTEDIQVNRAYAAEFTRRRINSEIEYTPAFFEKTAETLGQALLSVNERLDQIADLKEYNKIFRETCDLAAYLKHFEGPEKYDDCTVPVVYDNPITTREALLEKASFSRTILNTLYSTNIYGDGGYGVIKNTELDISQKIDFNSSEYRNSKTFSFEILPPPDLAFLFNRPASPGDPITFSTPWVTNSESIFMYDVQLLFKDPDSEEIIYSNDNVNRNMGYDIDLGPTYTQVWTDNVNNIFRHQYMFNIQGSGSSTSPVTNGKIKISGLYFEDTFGNIQFGDNLIPDAQAEFTNPRVPLPSVYTSYNVTLSRVAGEMLDQILISGRVPKVSLLINYYRRSNNQIDGPLQAPSPTGTPAPTSPTVAPVPTTGAPTEQPTTRAPTGEPTISPTEFVVSEAVGGFLDPADERFPIGCDQTWSYKQFATSPEISPDDDNCLPLEPGTLPFRPNSAGVDSHDFPAGSSVLEEFDIDPNRWCSVKVRLCPGTNTIYRPDSTGSSVDCTSNDIRRAWGFCIRKIGPAPTTRAPTGNPTTRAPTANPTVNPTADPTTDPTTRSPTEVGATANPTTDPTTRAPTTRAPTEVGATANPTANPTTRAPTTRSPTGQPTNSSTTTEIPDDFYNNLIIGGSIAAVVVVVFGLVSFFSSAPATAVSFVPIGNKRLENQQSRISLNGFL